ncbi:T9SS type A sorting domain-containing protein [candidate division KSB1 bacterium]|nr:T9SS type A sorting domain-containing protein [candidate division KSB1 bacterium]
MKKTGYTFLMIASVVLAFASIMPAQTITLISPNGGENWQAGTQHEIKWNSSGFSDPIQISISFDGWGATYWLILAPGTDNDGSFMWTIPNNYKSTICVVRVQRASDHTLYDLSNAYFTISSPVGTFNFDDGTVQGWTVSGPYGDGGGGPVSSNFFSIWKGDVNYPNPPGLDPANNDGSFSIGTLNGHGITGGLSGTFWIMQMKSPDLTSNATWQSASGYTIRIADCMGYSKIYANLYVRVYDNDQAKDRYFYNGTAQELSYDTFGDNNAVWNSLSFDWSGISTFPSNYVVKQVMVYVWGHLAGIYEGGVYLDEVVPTPASGPSNNTPTGTNVTVNPGSGVEITFDNVTGAGNTTVSTTSNGTPPPGGFQVVPSGSPVYYDIETTASFSGNVEICIPYNDAGMTPAQEAALKLQVYENPPGQWTDITTSLDVNANIICGTVSHLSEFAIMFSSDMPVIRFDPPVSEMRVGHPASVNVVLDGITDLGSFEFEIDYDGVVLQVAQASDVAAGDFLGSTGRSVIPVGPDINNSIGSVVFGSASLGAQAGPNGSGVLATISWTPMAEGMSPIDLKNVKISDTKGSQIAVVDEDGEINVTTRFWADVDGDQDIDIIDVQLVAAHWNTKVGDPNYDEVYDVDNEGQGDGDVDIIDVQLIASWWNKPLPLNGMSNFGSSVVKPSDDRFVAVRIAANKPSSPDKYPSLTMFVANVHDLGAFQFDVVSQQKNVKVLNVELGGFLSSTENKVITLGPAKDAAKNRYTIGAFSYGNQNGPDGVGTLVTVYFDGNVTNSTPIEIANIILTDINGNQLQVGAVDADYTDWSGDQLIPDGFVLQQNYPNPFNPTTFIRFDLPASSFVSLNIFNMQGQLVRKLVNETKAPDTYTIQWNGLNEAGERVPSGIYIYTLNAGAFKSTRKMLLLK